MDIGNCPVTLDEFKEHLRIPECNELMDNSLVLLLLAAATAIENFTLVNFDEDFTGSEVPFPLKAAILLTAGNLYDNPNDRSDTLTSLSKNLAQSYKRWDRISE